MTWTKLNTVLTSGANEITGIIQVYFARHNYGGYNVTTDNTQISGTNCFSADTTNRTVYCTADCDVLIVSNMSDSDTITQQHFSSGDVVVDFPKVQGAGEKYVALVRIG